MSKLEQKPPVQESTPSKPVQSVAPQARDSAGFNVWDAGTDSLVNLWDSSSEPPPNTSQTSNLVDLMGDNVPPSSATATASAKPQPLVSFDDMVDGTFSSAAEDDPTSLVDVTASDQMTLSYQHALQHASMEGPELDDGQLLMTNGETLLKEGTQVRRVKAAAHSERRRLSFYWVKRFLCWLLQASEGYFSQSQEDEFGQSEESSAKPAPVFYNKPPGEKRV